MDYDAPPRSKDVIPPIQTIPPEILCQILYPVCCQKWKTRSSLHAADPRWGLSSVSRSWREVLLSSPALWSVININLKKDYMLGLPPASARRAFDLFMKRSGQHSLDIIISLGGTRVFPHYSEDNARYIISCLCREAARWRRVKFCSSYADEITEMTQMLPTACEFPLLQDITIEAGGFDDASLEFTFPAPRLRRGKFNSAFVRGLPWEQLTELTLSCLVTTPTSVEKYLDVLAVAQHLRSLFIFEQTFESGYIPLHPRIVILPSVHTLCIDGTLFMHHLSLPTLQYLHLTDDSQVTISSTVNLFLSRSGCTLTSLHLQRVRGQDIPLILSSKSCMNTLTCLIIKGSGSQMFMPSEGAVDIFTVLSQLGADARYLPCLKDVSFDFGAREEDLEHLTFWDVLEERARTMESFQVVVHSHAMSANEHVPLDNGTDTDGRCWPMTLYSVFGGPDSDSIKEKLRDAGMSVCLSVVRMWKSRMEHAVENKSVLSALPSLGYHRPRKCALCWDL